MRQLLLALALVVALATVSEAQVEFACRCIEQYNVSGSFNVRRCSSLTARWRPA